MYNVNVAWKFIRNFRMEGKYMNITTGFDNLDKMLTGMHGGDLILVASRPAMGKTGLALNIVNYLSVGRDVPCLFCSMEMTSDRIKRKLINIGGDGTYEKIRDDGASLYIMDDAYITLEEICAKAKEYKEKHNIELVVVDYLQLINSSCKGESRISLLDKVVKGLKSLALELDVPVLVISQLGRDIEGRGDKRPVLSDLRESISNQDEIDVVMFVYRDAYYNADSPKASNTAEIIVAKNCHGDTGTVELKFQEGRFFE